MPYYVKYADIGDQLIGIPYCRGGYFLDLDSGFGDHPIGITTGNIHPYTVSHSIGLDCSGFVSYAYGISHHTTYTFKTYGHYVNVTKPNSYFAASIANLRQMDFLLYRNADDTKGHVVLFDRYGDENGNYILAKVQIIDANRNYNSDPTAGKVAIRIKNISDLNNFVMRSPWGCGGQDCNMVCQYDANNHWEECSYHCGNCTEPEPHTLSTDFEYDDNGHWKVCTDGCGYATNCEEHTWGATNLKYWEICSVCGYMKYTGPSKLSAVFENFVPDCQ